MKSAKQNATVPACAPVPCNTALERSGYFQVRRAYVSISIDISSGTSGEATQNLKDCFDQANMFLHGLTVMEASLDK